MKNTIIIILSIAVIVLGGYLVYDKVSNRNDNKIKENENNIPVGDNQNSNNENDEEVPFLKGLKSITYHCSGDGTKDAINFEKTISDNKIMKEILLIINDKEKIEPPSGLGGAFSRYLLLKYEDTEIRIEMPYIGIISIIGISVDTKHYNVSQDAYAKIENIFGYNQ